jgi:hypothetical protein
MVNRRYALIGVEGNHDQAFLCRVLDKLLGFRKFNGKESDLDTFWRKFVPIYPPKGGRLYMRLDMPSVLQTEDVSVAIYAGEGSKLITKSLIHSLPTSPATLATPQSAAVIVGCDRARSLRDSYASRT